MGRKLNGAGEGLKTTWNIFYLHFFGKKLTLPLHGNTHRSVLVSLCTDESVATIILQGDRYASLPHRPWLAANGGGVLRHLDQIDNLQRGEQADPAHQHDLHLVRGQLHVHVVGRGEPGGQVKHTLFYLCYSLSKQTRKI